MKVLIMAAGRGTRLSRYLSGNPKCMVDIGGGSLIQYTVKLLEKKGIQDIGIILGYRHDVIKKELSVCEGIQYFYNPFFDVTNSIASAWFAKEFFTNDDMILMNGDVYLEETLLDQIFASQRNPVLFSDETRKEEADYKFYYENNILKKYGKELKGNDVTGEYIGIARINSNFIEQFRTQMELMISVQKHSVWWENILYELSKKQNIYVEDIGQRFWAEVDYIEDYERILKYRGVDSLKYKLNK